MSSGATNVYSLPYPIQTDPVDVASDIEDLAESVETELLLKAPLLSPEFTGNPTATTQNNSDNSTRIATTAYVKSQNYLTTSSASTTYAPIASPTFTGTVAAPTPTSGDNTTKIATTAFVTTAVFNHATTGIGVHDVVGKVVGTTDIQTLTNKTINGLNNTLENIPQSAITGLSGAYAPLNISFVQPVTNPYQLQLNDVSSQIEMNFSVANTITIPTDSTQNFPIGTTLIVAQTGNGQTTVSGAVGVTLNATPGTKLRTRWSTATLIKRSSNTWLLFGDVIA